MTYLKTKSSVKKTLASSLLVLLLSSVATPFALAAEAFAIVSKTTVDVNEPFQLDIEIDDTLSNSDLDIGKLSENFAYSRPSISNNTSIINGHATRKTIWRLTLAAKKSGTFVIPSFDLGEAKTQPITIKVNGQGANQASVDEKKIRVETKLNSNQGYIGESFIYTVRLLIGTQVDSPALSPPKGKGLTVTQLGEDVRSENIINGQRFIVINRQYSITPNDVGKVTIEGAVLTGGQIKNNGWGNAVSIPFERKGADLTLKIKEKPANYQGFWLPTPSLSLSQRWGPDNIEQILTAKVGEPINRELTLTIRNIDQSMMPNISIQYPDTVRVYSDKPVYEIKGNDVSMIVKQALIPREAGEITLPDVSITWFNTQTEKQETTVAKGLTLSIEPGDIAQTIISPDIQSPAKIDNITTTDTPIVNDAGYWPWLTAFFAALWLGTLALYLSQRKANATALSSPIEDKHRAAQTNNDILNALKSAVKNKDTVAITTHFRQWSTEDLDTGLRQEIEYEMQHIMAAQFSTATSAWQGEHLLSLLDKASREQGNKKRKETALSHL